MPKIVIANTSPMFYLHRLGLLEILEKLYSTIVVPSAVIDELEAGKVQGEDVPNVQEYLWIQIEHVKIPKFIKLITDLAPGEAEVLALAIEKPDSLMILDERLARSIAELQGLRFTGTAGILLKTKSQGYITLVSPIIEQLLKLGFRISNRLKLDILKLAGELSE